MPSDIYPVFSWSGDPPADDFQEEDIYEGLFKGYLLERVMRHIFTGPSTALGEESRATRACNAELHDMAKVEAAHIAYGCVLARFGITSKNRWSEKDGQFSYRRFYYHVLDDIESNDDQAWKDAILRHHNMVLFKHERGRNAGSGSHSDGHRSPASESSSDPFLVKMRAQAAARASAAGSKSSDASVPSERRGPSAVVITPPPSSPRPSSPPPPPPPPSPPPPSPPRGREPSPPPSGPQGVLDLSELLELDEDMSTAKTKANSKSRPTKKAKNLAVVSDDEDKETPEDPGAQKSRKQPKRGGRRKGRK
ncbi:hypothetical protein HYDPIDRAFT_34818 [Hydnomerulius pinastri MD-312]|uniref:Uncharacterized protein n=1 Tax=Hydnomerulius pinastri MD-312 TaxID=994086 RepID=A0A0C9UXJ7_9AGAM|nr:hypothetical protein HYDPIDRAFT_34818 [Hydnomerulius pinastri MD-312]